MVKPITKNKWRGMRKEAAVASINVITRNPSPDATHDKQPMTIMSQGWDLNPRPPEYKTATIHIQLSPTEKLRVSTCEETDPPRRVLQCLLISRTFSHNFRRMS